MLSYFSIGQALGACLDDKVAFRGQVQAIGEIQDYKTRNGSNMRFFSIKVAQSYTIVQVRSYQVHSWELLRINCSYLFQDVSTTISTTIIHNQSVTYSAV